MAAPYPVLNLGTMAGNQLDSCLKSIQHATIDFANGSLLYITGMVTGQPDTYTASTPTDVTTQEVLLVAGGEVIEVNGLRVDLTDPTQFVNVHGRPMLAYHLKVGDNFTITDDGITGTTVLNQWVIPVNGTAVPAVSTTIGATRLSMQVVAKTTISVGSVRKAATRLLVVKN